jgi:hypothetical protein
MLAAVLTESIASPTLTLADAAVLLWEHAQILEELVQLMAVLAERVDHIQPMLSTHAEVPLLIHARYTRREILAAFSDGESVTIPEWRDKSFVQRYRVTRGEDLILECEEVRIFAANREGGGIRAVPIPAEIRRLCEQVGA